MSRLASLVFFACGLVLLALAIWQWNSAGRPLSLRPERIVAHQTELELPPATGPS